MIILDSAKNRLEKCFIIIEDIPPYTCRSQVTTSRDLIHAVRMASDQSHVYNP